MPQHDYDIANATGFVFRGDINDMALAIVGRNSGVTEPTTTFPFMTWADTTLGLMKQRNAGDDAWIIIWNLATGIPSNIKATAFHQNFIEDGDFSYNPKISPPQITDATYGATWWLYDKTPGVTAIHTMDVDIFSRPTFGQSGVRAFASLNLQVFVAQTSPAVADFNGIAYHMIGSNYSRIAGEKVTLAFWVNSTVPGTYSVCFKNNVHAGGTQRNYVMEYVISFGNAWQFIKLTLTLDVETNWLFNDDGSLAIIFTLMAGTAFKTASLDQWLNGVVSLASTNQINFNALEGPTFLLTMIGLYLGDDIPIFNRLQLSTIRKQTDWQFKRIIGNPLSGVSEINNEIIANGGIVSSNQAEFFIPFDEMRLGASRNHPLLPTNRVTFSPAAEFTVRFGATTTPGVTIVATPGAGKHGLGILVTVVAGAFSGLLGKECQLIRTNTAQPFIDIDSRFYFPT